YMRIPNSFRDAIRASLKAAALRSRDLDCRCAASDLPGDAHARLAADAVNVVAEGDIELGEHARVGRRVEEVHTRRHLAPQIFEIVLDAEGCSARDERLFVIVG